MAVKKDYIYAILIFVSPISLLINFLSYQKMNEPLKNDVKGICEVIEREKPESFTCKKFVQAWQNDRSYIVNSLKYEVLGKISKSEIIDKIQDNDSNPQKYLMILELLNKLSEKDLLDLKVRMMNKYGSIIYPKEIQPLVEKRLEYLKEIKVRLPEEEPGDYLKRTQCI